MKRIGVFFLSVFFIAVACLASAGSPEESPLVEIQNINPRIRIDLRYTTADNFMKEPLYPAAARCFLRRETATKLDRVQKALEQQGLGLKVYDGYRPLSVQKRMWARFPIEGYVADPAKGSNHNRGAAADVTLVDPEGKELAMPSPYDEFSERAHRDHMGGSKAALKNREILQKAMEHDGFHGISTEWWHFDDVDCKKYPILDLPISSIEPEP